MDGWMDVGWMDVGWMDVGWMSCMCSRCMYVSLLLLLFFNSFSSIFNFLGRWHAGLSKWLSGWLDKFSNFGSRNNKNNRFMFIFVPLFNLKILTKLAMFGRLWYNDKKMSIVTGTGSSGALNCPRYCYI